VSWATSPSRCPMGWMLVLLGGARRGRLNVGAGVGSFRQKRCSVFSSSSLGSEFHSIAYPVG